MWHKLGKRLINWGFWGLLLSFLTMFFLAWKVGSNATKPKPDGLESALLNLGILVNLLLFYCFVFTMYIGVGINFFTETLPLILTKLISGRSDQDGPNEFDDMLADLEYVGDAELERKLKRQWIPGLLSFVINNPTAVWKSITGHPRRR
jgi:hypothetical protein